MTAFLLTLLACGGDPGLEMEAPEAAPPAPDAPPPTLDVRALSFPAGWLARALGGVRVTVTDVLPPGEDPPEWQPSAELIAGLSDADLIVANGAGFEAWLTTATLPEERLVLTAGGVEDLITLDGPTHSHGGSEHSHAGVDPHTWSDPLTFLIQARVLRDALVNREPENQKHYDKRMEVVEEDLRALNDAYAAAFAGAAGRKLASSHPAYNYLARRYDLDLTAFHFDPAEPLTAEQRAAFDAWAAGAGPEPVLLWEAQPEQAVLDSLPAGVKHVVVDPLEQPAEGKRYDYLLQATANLRVFREIFKP